MNHPLATLCDQFLTERQFLKNVTADTLRWYVVAFKNYRAVHGDDALPTKATLQQFVMSLRARGIRPITCNTVTATGPSRRVATAVAFSALRFWSRCTSSARSASRLGRCATKSKR